MYCSTSFTRLGVILFVFFRISAISFGQGEPWNRGYHHPKILYRDSSGVAISTLEFKQQLENYDYGILVKRHDGDTTVYQLQTENQRGGRPNPARDFVQAWQNQPLPEFELTDINGKEVSRADLRNKVAVFNFWFTRCGPCIREMPQLNAVVDSFSTEEVVFLAPTFDADTTVRQFLLEQHFGYSVLPGSRQLISEMKIQIYPTHLLVDRNGITRNTAIGYHDEIWEQIVQGVRHLLAED